MLHNLRYNIAKGSIMKIKILLFIPLLFSNYNIVAEQVEIIEGTSIIGNRELPKVLYIVPWKQSQLPDLEYLPIDRLVDEALSPIDRKVFKRQINFHEQLNSTSEDN